jgi:hypothetical protein
MIYKILHIKQKIEQHKLNQILGFNSGTPKRVQLVI